MRHGPASRLRLPFHAAALGLLAWLPALAWGQARDALPEDGRVAAGHAELARQDRALTITQRTPRAVLQWRSFDIGADAAVRFVQPDASAVALNWVLGGTPSRIAGELSGNGHVFLLNTAGVLVAPGARIDVGNLVATSLELTGGAAFDRPTAGFATTWQQAISANGLLAMAGLVAATEPAADPADPAQQAARPAGLLTLEAGADGHLRIGLDPAQVRTLLEDGGMRQEGGELVMSAEAESTVAASAVAGGGAPQARGAVLRDGRLLLLATPADGGQAGAAPRSGGGIRAFADEPRR